MKFWYTVIWCEVDYEGPRYPEAVYIETAKETIDDIEAIIKRVRPYSSPYVQFCLAGKIPDKYGEFIPEIRDDA